jgi:glycoside/pentoside/hexuronide:cation symporter, GPH family
MDSVVRQPRRISVDPELEQGRAERQPWWVLVAYGAPAIPLALAEVPILLYLPAFYAKEVGLSAGLVGLVFLLARVWDGFADILVGWLSDRTRSRTGRRKPWVLVGAPFLMIGTWYLCNPPADAGLFYLIVWAPLFYTADAILKIPHLSWGTELATEYQERSRIAAFRSSCSMLGNLFFVAAPLIFLTKDAPLGSVLLLISITTLALMPAAVVPLGLFVPDDPQFVHSDIGLLDRLAALVKDRVLIVFLGGILLHALANGVINSLAVFSFDTGLGLPNGLFWVIFILYVSTLCAVPFTMRLARRVDKHHLLAAGWLVAALVYGVHLWIPTGNFAIVVVLWIIAGIGNAPAFVITTSMLADIIDRSEFESGERRSGAYMAVYNLTVKIGLAMGVGLAFGLLQWVGYEPSASHFSDADAWNIRLLGFALPSLLLVPAVIMMWKHPITKEVQRQLRAQIDARNRVHEQG